MTAIAFPDLKQRASKLSERERQSLSAYLIRLGEERTGPKRKTARGVPTRAARISGDTAPEWARPR
jgi:hypothetical protein